MRPFGAWRSVHDHRSSFTKMPLTDYGLPIRSYCGTGTLQLRSGTQVACSFEAGQFPNGDVMVLSHTSADILESNALTGSQVKRRAAGPSTPNSMCRSTCWGRGLTYQQERTSLIGPCACARDRLSRLFLRRTATALSISAFLEARRSLLVTAPAGRFAMHGGWRSTSSTRAGRSPSTSSQCPTTDRSRRT